MGRGLCPPLKHGYVRVSLEWLGFKMGLLQPYGWGQPLILHHLLSPPVLIILATYFQHAQTWCLSETKV